MSTLIFWHAGCFVVWQEIMLGDSEVVLTGGAESMNQAPHVIRGIRFGIPLGRDQVVRKSTLTMF